MPNVMAVLPNIGGALCSTPQRLADKLAAEIGPVVWGTSVNFNGFRVLAALLGNGAR